MTDQLEALLSRAPKELCMQDEAANTWRPQGDIKMTGRKYTILVDLPGVDEDTIQIDFIDDDGAGRDRVAADQPAHPGRDDENLGVPRDALRIECPRVHDLDARGLLDTTLVLMMGEFGRGPIMTKDAGRDHWLNCMSLILAGGGLKHGQVIGSTDSRGYDIKDRPVRPQDLAATVFKYFGIDLASHWVNPQGRPIPIVTEGGQPISELI